MSELATVRAEIKAWEHSFKETNGRSANVDDIKANAAIAGKYKLYKKLSKVTASSSAPKKEIAQRPSTPPRKTRPKDPTSVLLSRSRQVQLAAPLAAFNPFSPQKKKKGKEREASPAFDATPRRNLFGKPRASSSTQGRDESPDPFPLIESNQPSSSTSTSSFAPPLPTAPTSAVSRARKRLRGEPVSPSPNKEKRRRVTTQIAPIPFPNFTPQEEDSDDDMGGHDVDSSFVGNSPVKQRAGGKSFSQLFEETTIPAPDFFGGKMKSGSKDMETGDPVMFSRRSGATDRISKLTKSSRGGSLDTTSAGPSNPLIKSKLSTMRSSRATSEAPSEPSTSRSSTKRPASDHEADGDNPQAERRATSPLIPPSPPPNAAPHRIPKKPTGKSQSKKKAKLEEQAATSDSDGMELDAKLKIVSRRATRIRRAGEQEEVEDDALELGSDPVLGYARFDGPRAPSPNNAQQEEGSVEVNLPDELRRVLALQQPAAPATVKLSDEQALVKGLLYGRRTTHFDANRGGEIWDVGEDYTTGLDEERNRLTEGEDDWEGEPVPWEVAEL